MSGRKSDTKSGAKSNSTKKPQESKIARGVCPKPCTGAGCADTGWKPKKRSKPTS